MSKILFPGGCSVLKIDAVSGNFSAPVLTLDTFTKSGNQWPQPAALQAAAGSGQMGTTGERVPFKVQGINVDSVPVDTVRIASIGLTRYDLQWTSADGKTVVVQTSVLLSIQTNPIAEDGEFGFVLVSGESVAAGTDRAYTVVYTP